MLEYLSVSVLSRQSACRRLYRLQLMQSDPESKLTSLSCVSGESKSRGKRMRNLELEFEEERRPSRESMPVSADW